ncbi:MAG: ATP-binding protein [Gammaproteobacteria bacterium]|nr:ATP-binding protein [Gammaproteobacteria bacterium]
MKSIQARLGLSLAGTLIILFVFQWAIVNYFIRHVSDEIIHKRLQQDADSIIAALIVLDSGKISLPYASVSDVYNQPFSGHYYRIDGPVNILRSRSLWDEDLPAFKLVLGEHRFMSTMGPLSQQMFTHAQVIKKSDKLITINIAHNVTDLETDVYELQVSYALISGFALLILLIIQTGLIQRGFLPVQNARKQIQAMQRGEIGELDTQVPSELEPLVGEINRLVSLLSQRIQRSRNALGNLAHALKAPITVLTQIASEKENQGNNLLTDRINHQTVFMKELVERELKRARLACASGPGRYFSMPDDVNSLVDMLETIYREKDLAMDINIPVGVNVPVDREDMMEMIGNLLDNACKHAKQIIKLSIIVNESLVIVVEDDGPGVPCSKIDELTNRGTRIDESKIGHGLGLAIVIDTINHYGGNLQMGESVSLGGFRVAVKIPLPKQ